MDTPFGAEPAPQPPPLGELLVERGLLTREQLDEALVEQVQTNRPLGEIVVKRGWVPGALIGQALATQVGGLVKSEYGFATGFAPLPAPTAPLPSVASEPVASPEEEFSAKLASLAAQLEKTPTPSVEANGFAPPPTIPLRAAPAPIPEAAEELSADLIARAAEAGTEAQRQLQQVRLERDHAQRQLEEVTTECDRTKERLADLASKHAQAAVELAQARERLARLSSEHEQVTSELAQLREHDGPHRVLHADRHLVLAPGEGGYRLVERSGPAPEAGETIELDDRHYLVTRVGIAPLPGELVACSYAIEV